MIDYVDCFAGPWQSSDPDCNDTSFGIALSVLSKAQQHLTEGLGRSVKLRLCLIESHSASFKKLREFADAKRRANAEIVALEGEFEDQLGRVQQFLQQSGAKSFRFVLLDPKGWTGFALRKVAPLVDARSAEILVNVMTYHIRRFVSQEEHAESFDELFGDPTVAAEAAALRGSERERFLVQRYAANLKRQANFAYTSIAAVFRSTEDTVHYYLVFGTKSPHGIQVFKNAERTAFETGESARDEAKSRRRTQRTGEMEFDLYGEQLRPPSQFALALRAQCQAEARGKLEEVLTQRRTVLYDELLGNVLESPLVWESDLLTWIDQMCADRRVTIDPPLGRKKLRLDGGFRLKAV